MTSSSPFACEPSTAVTCSARSRRSISPGSRRICSSSKAVFPPEQHVEETAAAFEVRETVLRLTLALARPFQPVTPRARPPDTLESSPCFCTTLRRRHAMPQVPTNIYDPVALPQPSLWHQVSDSLSAPRCTGPSSSWRASCPASLSLLIAVVIMTGVGALLSHCAAPHPGQDQLR